MPSERFPRSVVIDTSAAEVTNPPRKQEGPASVTFYPNVNIPVSYHACLTEWQDKFLLTVSSVQVYAKDDASIPQDLSGIVQRLLLESALIQHYVQCVSYWMERCLTDKPWLSRDAAIEQVLLSAKTIGLPPLPSSGLS